MDIKLIPEEILEIHLRLSESETTNSDKFKRLYYKLKPPIENKHKFYKKLKYRFYLCILFLTQAQPVQTRVIYL